MTETRSKEAYEYRIDLPQAAARFGFTTRDFPCFIQNSRSFAEAVDAAGDKTRGLFLDPGERLASSVQTHSDHVAEVTESQFNGRSLQFEDTDGLVTRVPGVKLFIFSADCLPVFFAVPSNPPFVALAHAGWRGTEQGITGKTARLLRGFSGVDPGRWTVLLGPALRPCCYEVGPEFELRFPLNTRRKKEGGPHFFDLIAENRRQLEREGVGAAQIVDPALCTSCRNRSFYSYRKEKDKAGRTISWAVVTPKE